MAQVQDLRNQNLQLQRSQQELSQAVASAADISQSYGDRMTQILSTLAKFDAMVQGYQQDSKAVEASVSDHLKMSNSNTAKCFSAVKTLATRLAAVASRIERGTTGTPCLQSQIQWSRPRRRRLHPFLILSRRRLRRPWARHPVNPVVGVSPLFSVHPSHDCIYHPNACPDLEWPRGGEELNEHPHQQEPTSWRGNGEKQKEPAIPEGRAAPEGEQHPTEPTAPWTRVEENTSSSGNINPLMKKVFTSPGKPSYTPSHPTDTCTFSPVKVAPSASGGAPPTMARPAYHPYQMPMVQNSYTKAVEESDMP